MLVLNDAQALVIENLLTKMLINDSYSVTQLEEAIGWLQREGDRGLGLGLEAGSQVSNRRTGVLFIGYSQAFSRDSG
jgi:hypothetical protein